MNLFNPFRRFRKPEHVHSWKPIAVKHGVTPGIHGQDATQIMRLCDCGEYSTLVVLGHWEIEELSPDGIHEALERMASL